MLGSIASPSPVDSSIHYLIWRMLSIYTEDIIHAKQDVQRFEKVPTQADTRDTSNN